MTLAERIAESEAITAAILAGGSGWPAGLWDSALKRLEASAEALMMTDEELAEMSARWQAQVLPQQGIVDPTSGALLIERARRSTLTAHQRIEQAAERARLRG